jgi:predicted outer membrane protein
MKRHDVPGRILITAALVLFSAATPASAQTRPLTASEANLIRNMSDANILGHLASLDSFEVALSDSAILKSKSDTVLHFARAMRSAHLGSATAARTIGKELNIPLVTIAGEMRKTHVFAPADSVANASELQIDRHYLMQQIEMHDHMLAELNLLQDVARNERIKEHVRGRIPAVQGHLDYARQVAKAKGVDQRGPKR